MKCRRCKKAEALKHTDLCGICDILGSRGKSRTRLFGAQTSSLVPRHFNLGLGMEIEDYDHLKQERLKARSRGEIAEWY